MSEKRIVIDVTRRPSFEGLGTRNHEGLYRAWYKFSRNRLSVVGLLMVLVIVLVASFAPFVAPFPEHAGPFVDFSNANTPPSLRHLFGTDNVGRDILSRIFFGLRSSLVMGIVVLSIAVPVGVSFGLVGGYYKGTLVETILMRVTDVFLAVPSLILALAVASVLEPNLRNAMLAVSLMWWPWYARLVYGMTSSLRNEVFVTAAELTGASSPRIMFRELLPNLVSPIFTKMTLDVGWVILVGAALSFVGLGEQPPAPSLGSMVSDGAKYLPDQWWVSLSAGLVIVTIVLGFNLLGDGIRDLFAVEEL